MLPGATAVFPEGDAGGTLALPSPLCAEPLQPIARIVTTSLARATHFRRNVKTGCVMVNLPTAGTDYHVPFGGRGNSSYGSREQGRYAVEFYTQVKTAYIAAGAP